MGPKCWFFVYFFFGAPPKKPTLWPRGDKKSKQKPCCVFTNFSNFFYLYEEDFGRHNKQNGISGTVMGEHTRTILSFLQTQPPTRFARQGQALRARPRGREAAPRGLRIKFLLEKRHLLNKMKKIFAPQQFSKASLLRLSATSGNPDNLIFLAGNSILT